MDTLPNADFFFSSPLSLSLLVGIIIAWIKQHIVDIKDWATVLASFAVGATLGVVGFVLGMSSDSFLVSLANGIVAGFLASGGYDLLSSVIRKGGQKTW